jgi:hypothetical protein
MAKPMTAAQSIAMLKKWHIPYIEHGSWETHNRGSRGNGFSDINGLIVHHTGSSGLDQWESLYDGTAALPGPLCHWGLDQKGTIHNIGWGRCNHAGGGDPAVLKHVINEDYTGVLHTKYGEGDPGATDGNGHFYGVEIWYDGSHEMSDEQYFTLMRLSAAICDFHKWSEKSVIAHGEWNNQKWDPGVSKDHMMNMSVVREDIAETIKLGPAMTSKPVVYKDVWEFDGAEPPTGHATPDNPTWAAINIARMSAEYAEKAFKNTEEILKILKG